MQVAFVPPFQSPHVSQHKHLNSMLESIRESSGKQQSFHFCFQRELWVLDGGGGEREQGMEVRGRRLHVRASPSPTPHPREGLQPWTQIGQEQ